MTSLEKEVGRVIPLNEVQEKNHTSFSTILRS